ncbi:hypothetical protein EVAR_53775_1 [Eumeta japonica]|uniref:Uncharacterized protein n=1 Tax=Eumeta variegata TaxID=151549 RepID=A0A4C1Z6P3_EUMVA|nr:hypothetical protein EVAR_53775_1 [Eumeta japonica]
MNSVNTFNSLHQRCDSSDRSISETEFVRGYRERPPLDGGAGVGRAAAGACPFMFRGITKMDLRSPLPPGPPLSPADRCLGSAGAFEKDAADGQTGVALGPSLRRPYRRIVPTVLTAAPARHA